MQFQYVALLLLLALLVASGKKKRIEKKAWYKMDTDALERDWAGDEAAVGDDEEVVPRGPMIMVQLNEKVSVSLSKLKQKYESMLKSGSLKVDVSEVGSDGLKFKVNKAWQTPETMRFLALQPEVESFAADDVEYLPAEFLKSIGEGDEDEDDDEL
jgi:hypothetical protein